MTWCIKSRIRSFDSKVCMLMPFGTYGRYQWFVLSRQPGKQKKLMWGYSRVSFTHLLEKNLWTSTFFTSKWLFEKEANSNVLLWPVSSSLKPKPWTLTCFTGIGEFNFWEQIIRGCHWDELRSEGSGHLAVAGSRVAMSKNSSEVLFKTTFIWRWQIISWQALQGTTIRPKWPSSL